MKRALLIFVAVALVASTGVAQAFSFSTRVNPTSITSGTNVQIGAVISDVTQVNLASRQCFFLVGTNVRVDRQYGRIVVPPILYAIDNFSTLRGNAVGARAAIRVPRLPPNLRFPVYFQEVAVVRTRGGTSLLFSDIARALVTS